MENGMLFFYLARASKEGGVRESNKLVPGGRVAGGEGSGTLAVLVTEVGSPRKMGSKAGWTRHRELLGNVLGGLIRNIPRKTGA